MSHHLSGPRAEAQPIADITDVYAFPSPERPGWLVLVLNTLPLAPPSALFSDGLIYRFRLRPLEFNTGSLASPFRRRRSGARIRLCIFGALQRSDGRSGGAGRDVHGPNGRDGHVPGERRGWRRRARCSRLRRCALGPVHHGCAGRVEDDRYRKTGLHRPGLDLPRRKERARPGGRSRLCPATRRRGPVRRSR